MTIARIISARRQRLLNTFVSGFPPLVEVEGRATLSRLMHLDEFAGGSTPEQLGRRATGNVVLMPGRPGDTSSASVWVRPGYSDYRGAYRAFLRARYGLDVSVDDLAPYDIDHLLNQARAGCDTVLLRIEALPKGPNRQWGALLEKLASQAAVAGNRKTIRLMSHLIAGKVAGLPPPAGLDDVAGRLHLAQGLAALGLPLHEVRQALDDMLDHIGRNL